MMYNSFNEVKKMENGVLLQGFHWYIKPEEKLWKQLQEKVKSYKEFNLQEYLISLCIGYVTEPVVFAIF